MIDSSFFTDLFTSQQIKIKDELDKLYWSDSDYYLYRINEVKSRGYKVLRNEKGEHKILCGNQKF